MDTVTLDATILNIDMTKVTVANTPACHVDGLVESMVTAAHLRLLYRPGSLVTLKFAISGVQMVMGVSVEEVCLVNSVLM